MEVEITDALSQVNTIILIFVVCHFTAKYGYKRATLFQRILAGYFIMTLSTIANLSGYYAGQLPIINNLIKLYFNCSSCE